MKKKRIALLLGLILAATATFSSISHSPKETVFAKEETADINISGLLNMDELCGWATVAGSGMDGVTGGGNAAPCVVTTLEELEEAAADNVPRVIIVSGKIICGGYGVLVGSNKTIVGEDENACIYGGLRIHDQSNIIVSNLQMMGTWPNGGPDDCLEIKNSHHLWLTHLNVWNSTDGNMDITLGSDYITVSWCKFWYSEDAADGVEPEHNHRLSNLIGSGAGDHDDTDMGKLRVTYHHNWFADLVNERMPRVMYGRVHVYNNYYTCENNAYCVGADSYASVLIENNYFKNVNNPHEFSYTPGLPASITARGNIYDNTKGSQTTGQHYANSLINPFETTVYDYYLNEAEDVPEIVSSYAGPHNQEDALELYENLNTGSHIAGVEEEEETVLPSVSPLPTQTPVNTTNDNPITYNNETDTYTYNGQNSDGSNAYYTVENPYKGYDFSEDVRYKRGYPYWTKGATISYWVKVPENAVDAAVLNFNLENNRQMQRRDEVKYRICKEYTEDSKIYSMGAQTTYVDANGKEYQVLEGYGPYVYYNPNYPAEGCYTTSTEGGAIYAYEKGTDSDDTSNWTYLNYIGEGYYQSYGYRFDEAGGSKSKIQEAKISGSLSIYASGTMGYRQDNWYGLQMNPYLSSYGNIVDIQQYNQFYYWGNGGYQTLDEDYVTPTMKEKGKWHFVVVVIQNDWIQFYMDGEEMTVDYLSWWGQPINVNTGSKGFNLGYGQKMVYRTGYISEENSVGMTILDFISNEDTVLTIGGMGAGAARLGQENIGTPGGTEVKNIQYYYEPIAAEYILEDRISTGPAASGEPTSSSKPASSGEPQVSESPQSSTTPQPDAFETGDVNADGFVNLKDAQLVLRAYLKMVTLDEQQQKRADMDGDGFVKLKDAQLILRKYLKIDK